MGTVMVLGAWDTVFTELVIETWLIVVQTYDIILLRLNIMVLKAFSVCRLIHCVWGGPWNCHTAWAGMVDRL
jgi:hypothetical protein